jgi:hypothetical protein
MARRSGNTRRRFIQVVGAGTVAGLAGCGGGGGEGDGEETEPEATATDTATETSSELGPVPDEYVTATAQDGESQRDPDSLIAKGDVNYQSSPQNGQQCSNCRYYITDKNGDGLGACTLVEGSIEPEGWCSSYVQQEG